MESRDCQPYIIIVRVTLQLPRQTLVAKRFIDDLHAVGELHLIEKFIKCYKPAETELHLLEADHHVFLDMNINVYHYRPKYNRIGT